MNTAEALKIVSNDVSMYRYSGQWIVTTRGLDCVYESQPMSYWHARRRMSDARMMHALMLMGWSQNDAEAAVHRTNGSLADRMAEVVA